MGFLVEDEDDVGLRPVCTQIGIWKPSRGVPAAAAKEMPKDEIKAAKLYDTGIRHANNMALKKVRTLLTTIKDITYWYAGALGYPGGERCL